jgi:hypothetical protein
MSSFMDRDLGEQPIASIMSREGLKSHDLVAASTEQITHKMIGRAVKGRRLTPNVQRKILCALNTAAKKRYALKDLFNY